MKPNREELSRTVGRDLSRDADLLNAMKQIHDRGAAWVVVTDGILCGMEGILVQRRNNTRVVVSLDSIARSFVVEIDASCMRPLTARSGATTHEQAAVSEIARGYVSETRRAVYSVGA